MVIAKKKLDKYSNYLIFLYLIVFPFGQLLRFNIQITGRNISIHAIDIIVLVSSLLFIVIGGLKRIKRRYFTFFVVGIFSLLLSLKSFSVLQVFEGSLYLIRFFAYFVFLFFIANYIKSNFRKKRLLYSSLILVSTLTAVFGWVQYFLFPDLRFLKYFGWDDHYFRIVGTFLDPAFIGLIIVFGLILSIHKYVSSRNIKFALIPIFLLISLAFTYSRASYLALVFGLATYFMIKKIKYFIAILMLFLGIIIFLPRPGGEGVNLERVSSIIARYRTYEETLSIYKKEPLFGIGFNNLCNYRQKTLSYSIRKIKSHACAGSDSSLLLILTTTGIIGLIAFIDTGFLIFKNIKKNNYLHVLNSLTVALFIHSLFANSLFYPWVISYFILVVALNMKEFRAYK